MSFLGIVKIMSLKFLFSRSSVLGVLVAIVLAIIAFFYHTSPQRLLQSSADSFENNDFSAALNDVNRILLRNPSNVEALLMKATILAQQGSLFFKEQEYGEQVLVLAEKVLSIDPNNQEALRLIGYAHEIMQEYNKAHDAYVRVLLINPKNAPVLFSDAHAWDLQGDLAKAEAGYRAALAADPNFDNARAGLGRIYAQQGKGDEALAQFTALASTSNLHLRAEAAYSASSILRTTGNFEQAESYAREAIQADPKYPLGWVGLGAILSSSVMNDNSSLEGEALSSALEESQSSLRKALELNPNQALAYYYLAIDYFALAQLPQTKEMLEKAQETLSNDITLNPVEKERLKIQIEPLLKIVSRIISAGTI